MPLTAITCRYCGTSKDVPSYVAHRYSTCGASACKVKRNADRGAAAGAANRGRTHTPEVNAKKGVPGRKQSPDHIAARTAARKASGDWFKTPDIGKRISAGKKDGKQADVRGPANPNWRGGISKLPRGHRGSIEYSEWRRIVLERDGHACTQCGATVNVIAHHITGWHEDPSLRAEPENGVALCRKCHALEHRLIDNLPRKAGPWPHRPAVTTILCRYCDSPRYVRTSDAKRYSTCGSKECTAQRRRASGLASVTARGGYKGKQNPGYVDGRWAIAEKVCERCGITFSGRAKRRFCSPECARRGLTV